MIDRKATIQKKVSLPGYLQKLEQLIGSRPRAEELTSAEFVSSLRLNVSENIRSLDVSAKSLPFSQRVAEGFAAMIAHLEGRNPSPVFVWINASNDCGFAPPIRLSEFRFDFDFESIPEGLIVLFSSDGRDKLLMDFESGEGDAEILTVELYGENWGSVDIGRFLP